VPHTQKQALEAVVDPQLTTAITAALALIAVTLGYACACWIWPFKACPKCDGTGKRRSPSGRAFRLCRRCTGTGRRLRAGRWIYNQLSRRRREAR
jgi:DnaJ-class molecular chaperone